MCRAALVVLVPAADPIVGSLRRLHDPIAAHGVPAHVTVLFPFLTAATACGGEVGAAVSAAVAAVRPFEAAFATVGRFPGGVVWLGPRDGAPFVYLTRALMRAFPGVLPYGGAFETGHT